ncbi:hypothetical protein JCM6882_008449 [Rhodosporidiobolus microsporus]
MLVKTLLASLVAAAASAEATKILVPLYSWDEDCWPELQNAAASNPKAEFIAIINPNSGPITDTSDPSLYCVPVLREKIPGITLVGYVRTGYNERAASEVNGDIEMYNTWEGLTVTAGGVSGSPKLDGIFLDETDTFMESEDGLDKYIEYASTIKEKFGDDGLVIYNPGTEANQKLYDTGAMVVAYESPYSGFKSVNLPTDAATRANSAIMLINFPTDSSTLESVVESIVSDGYGALYITSAKIEEEDVYQVWGANWSSFVAKVAEVNSPSHCKKRVRARRF